MIDRLPQAVTPSVSVITIRSQFILLAQFRAEFYEQQEVPRRRADLLQIFVRLVTQFLAFRLPAANGKSKYQGLRIRHEIAFERLKTNKKMLPS